MSARYYGLLLAVSASLSLLVAGCSDGPPARPPDRMAGVTAPRPDMRQVSNDPADDTDETIFTWLGLAKRPSEHRIGPLTGDTVSPELWEAAHDALGFAGTSAEDPMTGVMQTKWYSPPDKPNERLRVGVFILSRALRSDSIAVTVEREARSPDGNWQKTPVAREVVAGLDNAILMRARHIHAERYRDANND